MASTVTPLNVLPVCHYFQRQTFSATHFLFNLFVTGVTDLGHNSLVPPQPAKTCETFHPKFNWPGWTDETSKRMIKSKHCYCSQTQTLLNRMNCGCWSLCLLPGGEAQRCADPREPSANLCSASLFPCKGLIGSEYTAGLTAARGWESTTPVCTHWINHLIRL